MRLVLAVKHVIRSELQVVFAEPPGGAARLRDFMLDLYAPAGRKARLSKDPAKRRKQLERHRKRQAAFQAAFSCMWNSSPCGEMIHHCSPHVCAGLNVARMSKHSNVPCFRSGLDRVWHGLACRCMPSHCDSSPVWYLANGSVPRCLQEQGRYHRQARAHLHPAWLVVPVRGALIEGVDSGRTSAALACLRHFLAQHLGQSL